MRSAADRRVDHGDAAGGDRLGGTWAARGVDDEDGIGSQGCDEAVPQTELLHLVVGEHTDDDGLGVICHRGEIGNGLSAQILDS